MKKIFLTVLALLITASLCITSNSCSKSSSTKVDSAKNTKLPDFTYTGSLRVNDTIWFRSNQPSTSIFLWNFGDGTTSVDSTPFHVYSKAKEYYSTTLVVNNDTAHIAVKTLKIWPLGASMLAGTWHWTNGMHTPYGLNVPGDTLHALPDTVFTITSPDESTIVVWGETLPYNSASDTYINLIGYPGHWGSSVAFRHDTIYFYNACCGGHHWDVTSYKAW